MTRAAVTYPEPFFSAPRWFHLPPAGMDESEHDRLCSAPRGHKLEQAAHTCSRNLALIQAKRERAAEKERGGR